MSQIYSALTAVAVFATVAGCIAACASWWQAREDTHENPGDHPGGGPGGPGDPPGPRVDPQPTRRTLPQRRTVRDSTVLPAVPDGGEPENGPCRPLEGAQWRDDANRGRTATKIAELTRPGIRLPERGDTPPVSDTDVMFARMSADSAAGNTDRFNAGFTAWWSALIATDWTAFAQALALPLAAIDGRTPSAELVGTALGAALRCQDGPDGQVHAALTAVRERWQAARLGGFTVVSRTRTGVVFRQDVAGRVAAESVYRTEKALGRLAVVYVPRPDGLPWP